MSDDLVQLIENARFTPVRAMSGYDMGEVDQLLDRVVAALREGRDVQQLIDSARFTSTKWREGYSMQDVDGFLARLRTETGGERLVDRAPNASAPPVVPGVIAEQRGLLSRLFGPRA